MREAPAVSEVRPEATAASWSARSRGNPSDIARRSPSAETTTVWDTPGVLSTKLVINQFRFCAAWLIGLTLTLLVVGAVRTTVLIPSGLAVRFTACPGAASALDAPAQIAQPAPDVLRGTGDLWAPLGGGLRGSLDQVGPGYPPRQAGGGDPARLGLPQSGGLLPALVVGRAPVAGAVARRSRSRRRSRRFLVHGPRAVGAVRAAREGAAAGQSGVGQLVAGGRGRSRTVEAYAVALAHVRGLSSFRFRRVLGRVIVLEAVLLRPVVLVAP